MPLHYGGWFLGIVDRATSFAYFTFVIAGLAGLVVRPIRGFCGVALTLASYVIGLDVWLWSAVTVHSLWGTGALIVGLLMFGVGVAPMALLATMFKGEWTFFGYILINLVILVVCRLAGLKMGDSPQTSALSVD